MLILYFSYKKNTPTDSTTINKSLKLNTDNIAFAFDPMGELILWLIYEENKLELFSKNPINIPKIRMMKFFNLKRIPNFFSQESGISF